MFKTSLFRALFASQRVVIDGDEVESSVPAGQQIRCTTTRRDIYWLDDQQIQVDHGAAVVQVPSIPKGSATFHFYTHCPLTEIDVAGGTA